jgi:4-amino-4-deoxy-L-arabinose transferase-like glycosyltransferase
MMQLTDQTTISEVSGDVKAESEKSGALYLVAALLAAAAVWVPLFVAGVQAHQANVDDFLYADVARSLTWDGNFVTSFLHTGTTSPLVPALAAPGADIGGVYGAMSVELPFFLMLVAGSYLLARQWISPPAAMVAALVVALNENVSGYAVMLHFAVPTAAALVWAFAAYGRSGHLREWKWSLILGLAVAVMLLSRSMAIVYVVPLVVVIGIDLVSDIAKKGHVFRPPALFALATTLLLAGPWWLVSGHAAIHYLQSAGYQPSSGFTPQGASLDATTVLQRAKWSLAELGWGESWSLAIAMLAALWMVVRHRHTLKLTSLWMLAIWVVLTSLILSSSSNRGTAYGLPVIVILIVLTAAVLGQMSWRMLPVLSVVAAGILAVGLVAEVTIGTGRWWPGAPYRAAVVAAGGNSRTNVDLLTAQVVRLIGSTPTLVAQDSDVLNSNGMRWSAGRNRLRLVFPPTSPDGTQVAIRELGRVNMVITGSSLGSYHPFVNQGDVELSARRDGFHAVRVWLGAEGTSFVFWQRGNRVRTISAPSPATRVLRPIGGTTLKGRLYLLAGASDRVFATTRVEFTISGKAGSTTVLAYPFPYGWIGVLKTTTLPNGTYTVRSVAFDAGGGAGRSKPIAVHVDN